MSFAITVGDNLETATAETYDGAKTEAKRLAFKYRDEVIVCVNVGTGTQAFTASAPRNCAGCDDE